MSDDPEMVQFTIIPRTRSEFFAELDEMMKTMREAPNDAAREEWFRARGGFRVKPMIFPDRGFGV